MNWSQRRLIRGVNFWPPFLGAGIRVTRIDRDMKAIDVEMKLRFWNRNYVGTHFGGSLYLMADPFFMVMLMENLGPDYIVWDKSATIRFIKPGRGKVTARFRMCDDDVLRVKQAADLNGKTEPTFMAKIEDDSGDVVAEIEKLLYVRLRTSRSRSAA